MPPHHFATIRMALVAASVVTGAATRGDVVPPSAFSGPRAFGHLEAICRLGPRPSGSAAMDQQRSMLVDHFRRAGARVEGQAFRIRDPLTGAPVHIENLIVTWHPDRRDRVLVGAHYDTRPFPDRDAVDARGAFVGANDGASGVAVLMELAAAMPALPGPVGVDFVLFDAEEYVFGERGTYCLGSTAFARQYAAGRRGGRIPHAYRCGAIVDMVADRELVLMQERQSVEWPDTQPIVAAIWDVARRLEVRQFVPRPGQAVNDDHVPLRTIAGIPCCDIIDIDYPHWHTMQDTPEHCSAESLEAVGSVVLQWLREQR